MTENWLTSASHHPFESTIKESYANGDAMQPKPAILVVEDHIIEQKLLQLLAKKYGFDVQIVSSSEEALSQIESGRLYSLILIDWKLRRFRRTDVH